MFRLPTFGGHEGLIVQGAPAHRVQLGRHDVAPEVGLAVLAVAAEAQQQQLAARGDNGGHPVRVRVALIGHLQLHTRLEAALQADLHLTGTNIVLWSRGEIRLLFSLSSLFTARQLHPHADLRFLFEQD